jgi:hypothetical protein
MSLVPYKHKNLFHPQTVRQKDKHGGRKNRESRGFSITPNKIFQIRRHKFSDIKLPSRQSIVNPTRLHRQSVLCELFFTRRPVRSNHYKKAPGNSNWGFFITT